MNAEPLATAAAVVADVEPPNPVHNVLITCGVTSTAHRDVFMDIEGLD